MTLADCMQKRFEDTNFVNNIFASYFHISCYFGSGYPYSHKEFVSMLRYRGYLDPMRDWVFCNYKMQCRLSDALLDKRWGWF